MSELYFAHMVIYDRSDERPQQGTQMEDGRTAGAVLGLAGFNAALTLAAAAATWDDGPTPWAAAAASSALVFLVLLRKR
ncbi:hypothetical protein OG365_18080 [Streptomyces sp. NBC_00853]|uniref:hypothetical protein n=2 Tax=Streptomyces TaxID=1883 RepID=UPI0038734BFC|nr:hypothetical protein OG365_18080 [Streptomyces sp. NBC_00853]